MAFIVDGPTEKKILQRVCPDHVIRVLNLNGKDVSLDAIAKAVASQIRLFRGRYFPVCVLVDREERLASAIEIEDYLRDALSSHDVKGEEVIISVPDRMLENWILSAADGFPNPIKAALCKGLPAEGLNGKSLVKQLLKECSVYYHETTSGVDLFCSINTRIASQNSASFERLVTRLSVYCRWIRKDFPS